MKLKRLSLTVFVIVLTLTIGISSITPFSHTNNNAYAFESEISDAIKKICPTYEHSSSNKDKISNILHSCLPSGISVPSPNDETAILVVTTILRANCTVISLCPVPDGIVVIRDSKSELIEYVLTPLTAATEGTTKFEIKNIPVGFEYDIRAISGANPFFKYQLTNFQGDCAGENTCKSVIKPGTNKVTANFHYSRIFP